MLVKNIRLTKNKSIEIQLDLFPMDNISILKCEFRINQKTDHAGIGLFLEIYKLVYFHIQFYDHRHWEHKLQKWEDDVST